MRVHRIGFEFETYRSEADSLCGLATVHTGMQTGLLILSFPGAAQQLQLVTVLAHFAGTTQTSKSERMKQYIFVSPAFPDARNTHSFPAGKNTTVRSMEGVIVVFQDTQNKS